MIVRSRVERPAKPEPRPEATRRWVGSSEPEKATREEFRPDSHERMRILVNSLCSRWPRARRELVAAAHHSHVWRSLAAVPGQVWARLAEARAQGRPAPGWARRELQPIMSGLFSGWARRDKVRW